MDRSFPARKTQDFVFGEDGGQQAPLRTTGRYTKPDDQHMTRKGMPIEQKQAVRPEDISLLAEGHYDPESELASFLYLMFNGQIETGEFPSSDPLKVAYELYAGQEWEQIHVFSTQGKKIAESQLATRGTGGYFVFNLEFDAGYRSLSPMGWPKLVMKFKSPKNITEDFVRGYGCIHVPTAPGRYERNCRIFCPIADEYWPNLKAKLLGVHSDQEDDTEDIARAEARSVTTVVNVGVVRVVFQVVQRNFPRFGYATS